MGYHPLVKGSRLHANGCNSHIITFLLMINELASRSSLFFGPVRRLGELSIATIAVLQSATVAVDTGPPH
jgi:hypothetical protein